MDVCGVSSVFCKTLPELQCCLTKSWRDIKRFNERYFLRRVSSPPDTKRKVDQPIIVVSSRMRRQLHVFKKASTPQICSILIQEHSAGRDKPLDYLWACLNDMYCTYDKAHRDFLPVVLDVLLFRTYFKGH